MRNFVLCRRYGIDVDTGEYNIIGFVAVNVNNIALVNVRRLKSDNKEKERYVAEVISKDVDRAIIGNLYKTEKEATDVVCEFALEGLE